MSEWIHNIEEWMLGGAEYVAQLNEMAEEAAARSTADAASAGACASTARAAAALWDGRMEEVLTSDFTRAIVAPLLAVSSKEELQSFDLTAVIATQIRAHLSAAAAASAQSAPLVAQLQVLLVAVGALQDFVANNYTGPPSARSALFAAWDAPLAEYANEWASQRLRMDGEDVYEHSYHPLSLLIAKCIFMQPDLSSLLPDLHSLPWWSMRYARAHQDLLEQNSATLKKHIDVIIPRAMAQYCPVVPQAALVNAAANEAVSASSSSSDASSSSATPAAAAVFAPGTSALRRRLCTHLYLEACHIYHGYWQYKAIEECLAAAQSSLGVEVELTGLMGKRTKWQREEKAQLLVRVIPSEKKLAEMEAQKASPAAPVDPLLLELLPYGLALDSDVLLNSVALSAHEQTYLDGPLSVSEQALLLAIFERTHRATSQHITRDEEMLCYITRVMEEARSGRSQNRSWAIECSALYHRSVLECSDKHSQDRALQQLEELSALFDRLHAATTVSSVAELAHAKSMDDYRREDVIRIRMRDVYLSNYPSIWTLKQGIAATFQKIGLFKSALDLFESINAYDGIIESCMLLGKITQAESLIRDRLKEKPADPKLLCLLADCTRDISFYEQAWEVSAHTYPRAQRSLANFKMGRGLHAEAIPHFQRALDLNPVFPAEWYAMGFCAIQTRQFDLATAAFSRTVSFDPEYANAWNNLAAAHLHLRNKPQAFSALEQAIKFQNESWKLWENYMLTAVDLHEYSKAMTAMDRIVDLKKDLNTSGEKEARMEKEEKTGEAGSRVLDEQVLTILCKVCLDSAREHGPNTFLLQRFIQLLHKISEALPTNAVVYGCLASALEARGEADKSLVFREKEVRFLQSAGWTDSIKRVQDVVRAHSDLTAAYIRSHTKSHLLAAKFTLDALLGKMRKAAAVSESKEGKECIGQVEEMLAKVAEAMPTAQSHLTAAGAGAASGAAGGAGAGLPSGAASSINIWR